MLTTIKLFIDLPATPIAICTLILVLFMLICWCVHKKSNCHPEDSSTKTKRFYFDSALEIEEQKPSPNHIIKRYNLSLNSLIDPILMDKRKDKRKDCKEGEGVTIKIE